jgi:hypothetical protein
MINFNKKDPVADVIRGIMEKELVGNQKKLDKNHNGKLDSQDFKMLRGQKKATEDVEQIDELKKSTLASYAKKATDDVSYHSFSAGTRPSKDPERLKDDKKAMNRQAGVNKAVDRLAKEDVESVEENAFDYKSPRKPEPNGGSGVKQGSRYGGSKQKEKPEQEEPKEKMKEAIEDTLHPAGAALLKHIKPQHHNLYKPHLAKGTFNGSYKDRTDVLNAAKSAGHLKEQVLTLKVMKENYEEPILDELINEVLSKDADAGDYIHDFIHSDNPKFAGKSKAERKKMALGAYYAKKNEEYVEEGMLKNAAKKAFKALTGGSDEDQLKALQKRAGAPVTGKKPTQKEEVVVEGRTPVSSPGMDTPFVTDAENKPLNNAKELAAKTMKRMKNEMLGKTGTSE